tara:strand:+ start:138 stop:1364 length:1227 start_codon:yes stop_codon:yes gene_type:complete
MIRLSKNNNSLDGKVFLESSKSISNRILIIRALSNQNFKIENLSNADDTLLMSKLLKTYKKSNELDCSHAGTTLRFLTSFLSIHNGEWILKGSERMHERPIGPLVESLQNIGADIKFLVKENHPPLKIKGKNLVGGNIEIRGDISSQYISALLMIAPTLNNGLTIKINSKILSRPYIEMTLKLMNQMGVNYHWDNSLIEIEKQNYNCEKFLIENDWSAASFWYSFAALASNAKIEIPLLFKNSIQGDSFLYEVYKKLGISTKFHEKCISIEKANKPVEKLTLNLSDYPDISLPIATTCAGLGIETHLYGLESLQHKESNRLLMIKNELKKFNIECVINSNSIKIKKNQILKAPNEIIKTHNDHRIPMSIAPLCMKVGPIEFENENVVTKSYPKFWQDLKNIGIKCTEY